MAYDVSGLGDYEEWEFDEVYSLMVEKARALEYFARKNRIEYGVNVDRNYPISSGAVEAKPYACGSTPSGDRILDELKISQGFFRIHEQICNADLQGKSWFSQIAAVGVEADEDLPAMLRQAMLQDIMKNMTFGMSKGIFIGDKLGSPGTGFEDYFDGLIKQIDAGSPVDGNTGGITAGTGITEANVVDFVRDMIDARPDKITQNEWEGQAFHMPLNWMKLLVRKIDTDNKFHYHYKFTEDGRLVDELTGIEMVGLAELNAVNRAFIIRDQNVKINVWGPVDNPEYKVPYDEITDYLHIKGAEAIGIGIFDITEIVQFTLVP